MKLNIQTSKGLYKYEFVPLFTGTKIIDKDISAKNLVLFYSILEKHNITVGLAYGTLLGAVREHDFITHDEDIDLFMSKKYEQNLRDSLFELRDNGFEVCRYDRRGLISFMRQGEYIDIYIFHHHTDGVVICGREIMPEYFMTDIQPMEFKGHTYPAPRDYERYLNFFYGDNWRTPIKYYHYEQPKWKRCINIALQYIKEFLPDTVFYALTAKGDNEYRSKYEKKLPQFIKR